MKPKRRHAQPAAVFAFNYMLFLENSNGKMSSAAADSGPGHGRMVGSYYQDSMNTIELLGVTGEAGFDWNKAKA